MVFVGAGSVVLFYNKLALDWLLTLAVYLIYQKPKSLIVWAGET